MKEPIQVSVEGKVFNLSPMKARKVGELERKLLKALAPLLAGMGGVLSLLPGLVGDGEKEAKTLLLQDALGMADLSRLSMGVQDALASLPDFEFDALLVGMCSSVSTHIEGKGNCTLITGDLIDAALESTAQMYKLMYEVARYNKFLPFGLVGAGDATPATAG